MKAADIKRYVSRLGNLTAVDKTINSIAGDKKMEEKVDILKTSRLPINSKLVEEIIARDYHWDEGAIYERQEQLANMAWDIVWKF